MSVDRKNHIRSFLRKSFDKSFGCKVHCVCVCVCRLGGGD